MHSIKQAFQGKDKGTRRRAFIRFKARIFFLGFQQKKRPINLVGEKPERERGQ